MTDDGFEVDRRDLLSATGKSVPLILAPGAVSRAEAQNSPPNFLVSDVNSNSPITEYEDLKIEYTIENTGGRGTQTIVGRTPDLPDSDPRSSQSGSLELLAGGSITAEASTPTGEGDAGEYEVIIESEDDSASTTVIVEESYISRKLNMAEKIDEMSVLPLDDRARATQLMDEIGASVDDGEITADTGEETIQRMVYLEEVQEKFLRGISDAEYSESTEVNLADDTAFNALKMVIEALLIKLVAVKIVAKKLGAGRLGKFLLEKATGLVSDAIQLLAEHLLGSKKGDENKREVSNEVVDTADQEARGLVEDLSEGAYGTASEFQEGVDDVLEATKGTVGDTLQSLIADPFVGSAIQEMEFEFSADTVSSEGLNGTENGAKEAWSEALDGMDNRFIQARNNWDEIEDEYEKINTVDQIYTVFEGVENALDGDAGPIERIETGVEMLKIKIALLRDLIGIILDSLKGLSVGVPAILLADTERTRGTSGVIDGEKKF